MTCRQHVLTSDHGAIVCKSRATCCLPVFAYCTQQERFEFFSSLFFFSSPSMAKWLGVRLESGRSGDRHPVQSASELNLVLYKLPCHVPAETRSAPKDDRLEISSLTHRDSKSQLKLSTLLATLLGACRNRMNAKVYRNGVSTPT